jgi:hypothetical protein
VHFKQIHVITEEQQVMFNGYLTRKQTKPLVVLFKSLKDNMSFYKLMSSAFVIEAVENQEQT